MFILLFLRHSLIYKVIEKLKDLRSILQEVYPARSLIFLAAVILSNTMKAKLLAFIS